MAYTMDEKDVNETAQTGVLSSGSSVIMPLKETPPNGGLEAWLQVVGAFFMYFNTWGKLTNSNTSISTLLLIFFVFSSLPRYCV